MSQVKVLFVCMGNICRSPTAEGVFRHIVNEEGHNDWIITDSAGTHAYHVEPRHWFRGYEAHCHPHGGRYGERHHPYADSRASHLWVVEGMEIEKVIILVALPPSLGIRVKGTKKRLCGPF